MEKTKNNHTLRYIIFFAVSMILFLVISLYIRYIEEMTYILNLIALLSLTIYAFICERIFRKGFVTRYVVYPIIVIIVYLLCLIYFISTNNLPIETTDIIYMYIIFLTVMIFAFPIAMLFDIVIDVRFNKKCKKLKNNKFAMMKNETEGIIFKNTQFEDILIFILILLIMYLVFAILN